MSAYSAVAWHPFFEAAAGAAAAVLGLLFVSLSINIQTILRFPHLPGRAAATLGILLSELVICFFGLAPGVRAQTFGWEIIAVAALAAAQSLWVAVTTLRRKAPNDRLTWTLGSLAQLMVPMVFMVIGGVSLAAGAGGGIYWILFGTALVFVSASINAWVLLVEILR